MKKAIILILLSISFSSLCMRAATDDNATAKNAIASRLIEHMQLSDDNAAKFSKLYAEYVDKLAEIHNKYPKATPKNDDMLSDAQLEQNFRNDFARSRAILDLREAYYDKFSQVLTQRQIKVMYRHERRYASEAARQVKAQERRTKIQARQADRQRFRQETIRHRKESNERRDSLRRERELGKKSRQQQTN